MFVRLCCWPPSPYRAVAAQTGLLPVSRTPSYGVFGTGGRRWSEGSSFSWRPVLGVFECEHVGDDQIDLLIVEREVHLGRMFPVSTYGTGATFRTMINPLSVWQPCRPLLWLCTVNVPSSKLPLTQCRPTATQSACPLGDRIAHVKLLWAGSQRTPWFPTLIMSPSVV